ncbi:unnamed protein product, partial [Mesorhabditis belari]|uniref:Uncharacterized protein n=1 Tax=Mesorhabditis belari TaxID=2138241 RepID=A0AAF3J5J0_9BILA
MLSGTEKLKAETSNGEAEEEGESWEDLDDETLDQQLAQLKLEAAQKVQGQKKPSSFEQRASSSNFDKNFLPYVLEVYDLPKKETTQTIKDELQQMGFPGVEVKMVPGTSSALVAFENEKRARDVQVLHKHSWIKLRSLYLASKESQDLAKKSETELRPRATVRPKTTSAIARRLVEGSLGLKSTVTSEKRATERATIQNHKDAKKAAADLWK